MNAINLKNVKLVLDNERIVGDQIIRRILDEIQEEEHQCKILNDSEPQAWDQWSQWNDWDKGSQWEEISASSGLKQSIANTTSF